MPTIGATFPQMRVHAVANNTLSSFASLVADELALLCCWTNFGTSFQLLQRDIIAAIGGIADVTRA
jgi:hypothetical protein